LWTGAACSSASAGAVKARIIEKAAKDRIVLSARYDLGLNQSGKFTVDGDEICGCA
jgi:hypothetical protein